MLAIDAVCMTFVLLIGQAEPTPASAEPELDAKLLARWAEVYLEEAKQYEIFLGNDRKIALELEPKPVFRWAEPLARNRFNGVIYVWTHEGRPEVVGSIWASGGPAPAGKWKLCHTFHSLATGPLEAYRNGASSWTPTKGGIELKFAPDSPAPAKTASQRLAQMRSIARELTVLQAVDAAETKEVELRLLPQPIYRYEAGDDASRDGAIFAYLRDWDPEILLLVEAQDTPHGPRWHYEPLRFCYLSARARYKDQEVWSYQKGGPMTERQHYYLSIHGASFVDQVMPE
jgi:hypothetical protein